MTGLSLMPSLPPKQQEQLVLDHMGLAKDLAGRLMRKLLLPANLLEEVDALATAGLAEAATRYDPTRGAAFSTFAYYRIRGAVYDGLRDMGVLGKRRRGKALLEQRTDEILEQGVSARVPSAVSGGSLESAIQELGNYVADLTAVQLVCMEVEDLPQDEESNPDAQELSYQKELGQHLHRALETLPDSERRILELAYFKDMSLKEAGDAMGLSRSWASRLHSRAVRLLREAMPVESL